jgi:ABC-type Fe3+/spermidine/putrescine transport system ATPase subunit
VDDVSLDVHAGEIVALLGASGCGKTTTLRMVAGLDRPTAGEIEYQGQMLVSVARRVYVPTHKRNLGMVFQSYALWPHMTVFENVAYPLRLRGVKPAAVRDKVTAVLDAVGLAGYEQRPVPRLSGGQQQRVALARALVYEPALLLLDEPFSNLDAHLRAQMRVQLKQLQRRLGLTCLFVTHDQVEALSLADRLAIMHAGRVEQLGPPAAIYSQPATPIVRDFLGRIVTLRGRVGAPPANGTLAVLVEGLADYPLRAPTPDAGLSSGAALDLSIRPEDVGVATEPPAAADNVLPATIETLLFLGDSYESQVRVGTQTVVLELSRGQSWREGQPLYLTLPPAALRVWDAGAAGTSPPGAP